MEEQKSNEKKSIIQKSTKVSLMFLLFFVFLYIIGGIIEIIEYGITIQLLYYTVGSLIILFIIWIILFLFCFGIFAIQKVLE